MRTLIQLMIVGSIAVGGVALVGCQQKGPAETAGEKVDNAVKKTGEGIEKAGEKVQDAAK